MALHRSPSAPDEASGDAQRTPDEVCVSPRASVCAAYRGKEGLSSMESRFRERIAPAGPVSDDAVEFVRFCYRRRKVGWPELYDEMCAVAGRGLFRGWRADELSAEGIGFSLFEMPALAALVQRVLAEEYDRGSRSPVAVVRAKPAETARESDSYGAANDDDPIAGEATDVPHAPLRLAGAAAGA